MDGFPSFSSHVLDAFEVRHTIYSAIIDWFEQAVNRTRALDASLSLLSEDLVPEVFRNRSGSIQQE